MRQLVITQNMTLDGVVEVDEATGDWFNPAEGEPGEPDDLLEDVQHQMALEQALLLGRRTFGDFRGYWPAQTDDTTGVTAHLNDVPKYVVSSTLTEPEWENTTVIGIDDLDATVRELKASGDGEIGATGSIELCHELARRGLVDEYRVLVYPVTVGTGRRLLPDDAPRRLRLLQARSFSSGVTLLRYEPDDG